MMFSDEEIKESSFMRPGDEIISIREVCLIDKFDKKDFAIHNEGLLPSSSRNDPFREGFFDGLEQQQARFAWTEEDGNIASLVSEPGFGTTGQTTFGKEIDAAMKSDMKEPDTSSSALHSTSFSGSYGSSISKSSDSQLVTSTSTGSGLGLSKGQGCKVDKADPRSRVHFVKYVKRHGRTVKLWECGICSREFQHQYTLMRHLPTHTDERNFHCVACGKSFRQLSTLSQHRAIHSAERPYACELCNKTFNRVSTLISHRKTHSDEKPYKCHICFKGFHQKGNLRNHLFTHTNERPYRCNICLKGFNQQSNLVCHKNKAHPNDVPGSQVTRGRSTPRITRPPPETRPDSTRSQIEHCEVSSSVGPYLPSVEGPSSSFWHKPNIWDLSKTYGAENAWNMENPWSNLGTGVIVDPIKTYHMGVALAKKQTPFALLKPDNGNPVLVKVVDTHLPGGQQMLVPATAEDLRVGGKIVMKEDDSLVESIKAESSELGGAVQIRVPVVATVVPKISPGGRLHLSVEEPHHAYHTALSADVGDMSAPLCSAPPPACTRAPSASLPSLTPQPKHQYSDVMKTGGQIISSTCALPPPAPSPPLDLIPMDLFEPMECIPMGPQVTAVGDIEAPPSDESDIFIGKFEESIPLSDSD